MRLRLGLIAGLTAVVAMSQATPCYADVVVLPDSSATSPMLWIAILFVVIVAGVSFFLLRRIARRRVAPTLEAPAPPTAPEAHHED
jgi:hypothetical protein